MWPFTSASSPESSTPASPSLSLSSNSLGRPLTNAEAVNPTINPLNPQGLKPCCACPETKKARDDCFLMYGSNVDDQGESKEKCGDIVERHRQCMRSLGFNV